MTLRPLQVVPRHALGFRPRRLEASLLISNLPLRPHRLNQRQQIALDGLKGSEFMTRDVKATFPGAKHHLLSKQITCDPDLGNTQLRVGYFAQSNGIPLVYTEARASIDLKRVSKDFAQELIYGHKPFGELLREYYPNHEVVSETISFSKSGEELPTRFYKIPKRKSVSKHERKIFVQDRSEKLLLAKVIEYI